MKTVYFSLSAISLAMLLQGCATASPSQASQTIEKRKSDICSDFKYTDKDDISDNYSKVYKIWRVFDEYYDNAPNGRKLAVFLDGTNNDGKDATNVRDMYRLAIANACNGVPVIPYYDKGVGAKWFEKIGFFSLYSGLGVSLNIRQAYRFLSQTYKAPNKTNNNQGDEIYIFGFSRGAFTARSLNGFIEFAGLLDGTQMKSDLAVGFKWIEKFEWMVDNIFDQYHIVSDGVNLKAQIQAYEERRYPEQTFDRTVKVKAIGVFDTVPALGFGLYEDPQNHKLELYANKGFHALSLDEHRNQFKLRHFNKELIQSDQLLSEVWFPGGHSNVGGGYAKTANCSTNNKENNSLETTPLNWMISKLKNEHIFLDVDPFIECHDGKLYDQYYDSIVPSYRLTQSLPRNPVDGDVIHESVLCRMQAKKLYDAHPQTEPNGKYQPTLPNSYLIESTRLGGIIEKFDATQCQLKTP